MTVIFMDQAWEDYLYWQQYDKKVLKKINHLIKDIAHNVYGGLGSPEPLKHDFIRVLVQAHYIRTSLSISGRGG